MTIIHLPLSSSSMFFIGSLMILVGVWCCSLYASACYTSIISFGDSLADTGNLKALYSQQNRKPLHFFFPPYGETFFHTPSGRCSNGRLIIDFLAESMSLPLVRPFADAKEGSHIEEYQQGVNYAVAGATALDFSVLEAMGVVNPVTNMSLRAQLEWFKQSWPSICANLQDCKQLLGNSLILMGEIGGNDYNHALIGGKSIEVVETYVPVVVDAIISAVNELIELGAKTLVIPGNFPIGCNAVYLTMYYGSKVEEYDSSTRCLIRLNKFANYHNELLQIKLNQLRDLNPSINIIYADYYNAALQFYHNPTKYGFKNGALKACCGGGGPFNFNSSAACADPFSTSCVHSDTYANWDGLHLTEEAYKLIYKSLFQGPYTTPQFSSFCPISLLQDTDKLSSSI